MGTGINVEHVNPFIRATMETFKSMVHCDITPGKVGLAHVKVNPYDVSGVIGLSGGAKGTVSLSFPKITALKIVSAFSGEKTVTLNSEAVDAVGELINIVAGSSKRDLSSYNINISLPTVVVGDNHHLQGPKDVLPITVPFTCVHGSFNLIISFKSEEK